MRSGTYCDGHYSSHAGSSTTPRVPKLCRNGLAEATRHWRKLADTGMSRIVIALLLLLGGTASAQELTLFAGGIEESGTKQRAPVWAFEYQHPLHENVTASFSWLNEGHVPGHHRDGQAFQIWGRANVIDRRLSLAAGLGPYRYFDTTVSSSGGGYANIHGWGMLGSLSATYYTNSRWIYQLRFNRIIAHDSINTSAVMLGVGYVLEPVSNRGPQSAAPGQIDKTTNNEVTASIGYTIVNSYSSEVDTARSIEYRRGLSRYVDVSVGLLNEGDPRLIRRTGIVAQIWGVREVLASDRLVLGIGFGPYLAIDRYHSPAPGEGGNGKLSWLFSAMAAYRLSDNWNARVSWNRTTTRYNRDTDVILFGLGYRY